VIKPTTNDQTNSWTRREALGILAAGPVSAAVRPPEIDPELVRRHDQAVDHVLERQVTDPKSKWCGSIPDVDGLHMPGSAGSVLVYAYAGYLHPQSRHYHSRLVIEPSRLAADFLSRAQNEDGTIDHPFTNFNSPPDTGFVIHGVATACLLAKRAGERELVALVEGFLRKAGAALAVGGIHTPNHRWVVSSALAQLNELFPNEAYLRRINQWLAEGIDIDSDGQYTERSLSIYNAVTNRALVVLADKLKRPELLDPVRRNLEAMLYLMHADNELVTDFSRRQDLHQIGSVAYHWLPLKYIGMKDGDGRFNGIANGQIYNGGSLATMMEYPQLAQPGPAAVRLPDNYNKLFPVLGVGRIRRGPASTTVLLKGSNRFLSLRKGKAVIAAVRFASAFFGKGQFVPGSGQRIGDSYALKQELTAAYYQPLDPPRRVTPDTWRSLIRERKQTEVCRLPYQATGEETANGLALHIKTNGQKGVPFTVEINLRGNGRLSGCSASQAAPETLFMDEDYATYSNGGDGIRFGPRLREHSYTEGRGQDKLPGRCVYLTTYTPVDHVIHFEWI